MNMCSQKFSIGNRVVVFQNTERTLFCSLIGKRGVIVGYRSKDALIQFDDGEKRYVYENDLRLEK